MRPRDLEERLSRLESRARPVEDDYRWKLRLLSIEELRRLEVVLEVIETDEDITKVNRAWLEEIDARIGPGWFDEATARKAKLRCNDTS